MPTKNLLVELFVEELPPKALKMLGESFSSLLFDGLVERDLANKDSVVTAFASPRRLAAHITNIATVAPDRESFDRLIPVSLGLDASGQPTEALKKRLGKVGRAHLADLWPTAALGHDGLKGIQDGPDRLFIKHDGKADAFCLRMMSAGTTLQVGLMCSLEEMITKLPIPKVMTYQLEDGWTDVKFVRPAHGLVALHGEEIVDVPVLGLEAGNTTQGHRFEAKISVIKIESADSYAQQLKEDGAVIASFAARRAEIVRQLQTAASKEGLQPITDEALLDEVTALVERPNVLTCQFEQEFLEVPAECLILTMKANQKYFPLLDAQDKLTNKFLVVSNITPADPSRVIDGNERVVRPRLADAKFFYDQDRKQTLASRLPRLGKIVYHNQLGSQLERVERVRKLAALIGSQMGSEVAAKADQAAQLAKADLVTDMVGEFPELQGIMGRYYALADGLDAEVAEAIREQYLPRGAGDELPATKAGMALALADKLETLCSIFYVGQKPTGAKDPFGLRRAAIGVLRIIIERGLSLDIDTLIARGVDLANSAVAEVSRRSKRAHLSGGESRCAAEVYDYVMERLRGYYLEGITLDVTTEMFDAVLTNRPASPLDFDQRLRALSSFLKLSDAQSLAAANKRINNILKKIDSSISNEVQTDKLIEPAERELYAQLQSADADTAPLFATRNYADALTRLATLRPAVDRFFDKVMVMADEDAVRVNRLALLSRLRGVFLKVADLSRLPG